MPPRGEDELDPVTLHNQGLMNMEEDPTAGFRKLNFLLQNPPFPAETFGNLLLLCVGMGWDGMGACLWRLVAWRDVALVCDSCITWRVF